MVQISAPTSPPVTSIAKWLKIGDASAVFYNVHEYSYVHIVNVDLYSNLVTDLNICIVFNHKLALDFWFFVLVKI